MSSDIGHLLWSGIVSEDRTDAVAKQLMSGAMFSGWGVRTMSTQDQARHATLTQDLVVPQEIGRVAVSASWRLAPAGTSRR